MFFFLPGLITTEPRWNICRMWFDIVLHRKERLFLQRKQSLTLIKPLYVFPNELCHQSFNDEFCTKHFPYHHRCWLLDLVTAETIRLLFSPNNSESTIFKNDIWILLYNYFCLHRVNPALNTVIRVFIQMFKLGIVLILLNCLITAPPPFSSLPGKFCHPGLTVINKNKQIRI